LPTNQLTVSQLMDWSTHRYADHATHGLQKITLEQLSNSIFILKNISAN